MIKNGIITKVLVGATSVLAIGGVAATSSQVSNINNNVQPAKEVTVQEPVVTTEKVTKTTEIPYETSYVDDNTLAKGKTKVVTEGVKGERTDYYTVTYTDGEETSREKTDSKVTKKPVNEVIAKGTYVAPKKQTATTNRSTTTQNCPNGTYRNSAGNTVCRPAATNTGGATAICRDGSYSYSQSRRGTCSHHGGVRRWL